MSLYVNGFPEHTLSGELHDVFSQWGRCKVIMKNQFAFINFFSYRMAIRDAHSALRSMNGSDFKGSKLNVDWSKRTIRSNPEVLDDSNVRDCNDFNHPPRYNNGHACSGSRRRRSHTNPGTQSRSRDMSLDHLSMCSLQGDRDRQVSRNGEKSRHTIQEERNDNFDNGNNRYSINNGSQNRGHENRRDIIQEVAGQSSFQDKQATQPVTDRGPEVYRHVYGCAINSTAGNGVAAVQGVRILNEVSEKPESHDNIAVRTRPSETSNRRRCSSENIQEEISSKRAYKKPKLSERISINQPSQSRDIEDNGSQNSSDRIHPDVGEADRVQTGLPGGSGQSAENGSQFNRPTVQTIINGSSSPWNEDLNSDGNQSHQEAETIESLRSVFRARLESENFNREQIEAITTGHIGPCQVHAGPGTGKTRVLTFRAHYLLDVEQVPPSKILMVTFAKGASAEISNRVKNLPGNNTDALEPKNTEEMPVKTFHTFAKLSLIEFGTFGLGAFDVCDENLSKEIIRKILNSRGTSRRIEKELNDVYKRISQLKCKLQENEPSDEKLRELREKYDTWLRDMNMLDFDDLILEFWRLLQSSSEVKDHLQKCYSHVLIDELQDTNDRQFDIISMLSSDGRNLFAVGDANQSIYSFSGTNVKNIEQFPENFENTREFSLVRNYRCSGNIATASHAVIETNMALGTERTTTEKGSGEKVRLVFVQGERDSAELEDDYVTECILKMEHDGHIQHRSDCAVISRTKARLESFLKTSTAKGIDTILPNMFSLFEAREVLDLLAILRVFNEPEDDESVLRIFKLVAKNFPEDLLKQLETDAEESNQSLLISIQRFAETQDSSGNLVILSNRQSRNFNQCRTFFQKIHEIRSKWDNALGSQYSLTVGKLLEQLMKKTKYKTYMKRDTPDKENVRAAAKGNNLEKFIEFASSFKDVSAFLRQAKLITNGKSIKSGGHANAIWLSTIHQSKGLQFKAVIIIGAKRGFIPLTHNGIVTDIDEERRLLYVGMSRTEDYLMITWSGNESSEPETGLDILSPFLLTRPHNAVITTSVKKVNNAWCT